MKHTLRIFRTLALSLMFIGCSPVNAAFYQAKILNTTSVNLFVTLTGSEESGIVIMPYSNGQLQVESTTMPTLSIHETGVKSSSGVLETRLINPGAERYIVGLVDKVAPSRVFSHDIFAGGGTRHLYLLPALDIESRHL